jgi:esterase/lipase
MSSPLFRVQLFPVEGSDKLACVVAGYRGKIKGYRRVIETLNNHGYNVVAYEHSPAVLTSGDPQKLIDLVNGINNDFSERIIGYKIIICVGASIGAGLCFALQAQFPTITSGIYAAAGVSPPENVFEAPLFYFVRKKFAKAGIDPQKLKKLWQDVDIVPEKPLNLTNPFLMVLGKKDKIVNYQKALVTLHKWQATGKPITIMTKNNLGHAGTIRWYKKHFEELLVEAEKPWL